MGKAAMTGVVAALVLMAGLLLVTGLQSSPAGIPERVEIEALNSLLPLRGEVFAEANGWSLEGHGALGHVRDLQDSQEYAKTFLWTVRPKGAAGIDPLAKLLDAMEALDLRAGQVGYGLNAMTGMSFGSDGNYGPPVWWAVRQAPRGGRLESSWNFEFQPDHRYATVTAEYISRRNPASRFRWTIICDRRDATFWLSEHYYAVGPIYCCTGTPGPGGPVRITFADANQPSDANAAAVGD